MKYIIDIDGTICYSRDGDYESAIAIPERIAQLNRLYDEGHVMIYFTARGMGRFEGDTRRCVDVFADLTHRQLYEWGVKYSDLWMGKPSGDFYIDDKGINANDFFD